MLEGEFQKKILKKLRERKCFYFVKEAASIRGIPDIIGCHKGRFFALEVKRSKKEASVKTGRVCLQKYRIQKIITNGGYAALIYPENYIKVLSDLFGETTSKEIKNARRNKEENKRRVIR